MDLIVQIIRWAQRRANAPRIAAHPNPYGVRIASDIPYMDDGLDAHRLDVYSPAGAKGPLPVILEVHGGGYLACFKEVNAWHGQYLAAGGFHVVNMNYTLCPEGSASSILNEMAAALDWIHRSRETYGFDTGRIALTGDSAGGHFVLLAAAAYGPGPLAGELGVVRPRVLPRAFAASCPEGSFMWRRLPRNLPSTLLFFILHKYTLDRKCASVTSYDHYMDEDFPKVWFCTSPTDPLLYGHTRAMHEYMEKNHIPHEYREYVGTENRLGHVFNVLWPDWPESRQANDDMLDYFRRSLN